MAGECFAICNMCCLQYCVVFGKGLCSCWQECVFLAGECVKDWSV